MRVIIVGMRGVGIEVAKNLSLQGVGAITIVDSNETEIKDLGLNFFLTEHDVQAKLTRGAAVGHKVQELNNLCAIAVAPELNENLISKHSALIITDPRTPSELIELNKLCRMYNVSFFYGLSAGVSGTIFVDHGLNHKIHDPNGDKPIQKLITEFIRISDQEIMLRYDHPAGQLPVSISSGFYEISGVVGNGNINRINHQSFQIEHKDSDPVKTVRIKFSTSSESDEFVGIAGGMLTEKKVTTNHPMLSIEEKFKNPGSTWDEPPSLVLTDLINFGSEVQQHVSFYALLNYLEKKQKALFGSGAKISGYKLMPQVRNINDAKLILECAKQLLSDKSIDLGEDFQLNEEFLLTFSLYAGAELQPVSAFMGGVLAQEVVKCTGKFTPIPGFLHFSAFETLPNSSLSNSFIQKEDSSNELHKLSLNENNFLPKGNRYDELASIFGWDFVEKLNNLKYFLVGCGALGCEFVKNFALNGICCGNDGKLIITDGDRIELSNLTRQFLFREHNVGQLKSKAAGVMARQMNDKLNIESLELYVGSATENVFDDQFWFSLSGVCNALDNMEARRYVDKMCIKYEKSLLESGTMGTSGNIDTICPFKTQTYSDGGNAVEGGQIPMCTLRNFPQITDHCIEWARDQFELLFNKIAKYFQQYLADPTAFVNDVIAGSSDKSQSIFYVKCLKSLVSAYKNNFSFTSLVQVAFDIFHYLFRDRILDLQTFFPKDKRIIDKNGVDKGPFWGEKKRYPEVAVFSAADESHLNFILATALLTGNALGAIKNKSENDNDWCGEFKDLNKLKEIINTKLVVPNYVSSPVNTDGEDIAINDKELEKKVDVLSDLITELNNESFIIINNSENSNNLNINYIDFEKDDDFNFHISFITSTANLRCDNYFITRTNFQSCKVIAGKIIAAIATTTAAVCGLVILELFKLVLDKESSPPSSDSSSSNNNNSNIKFMNRQIGLATNTFTSFTTESPFLIKTTEEKEFPPIEECTEDMYYTQEDEEKYLKEKEEAKEGGAPLALVKKGHLRPEFVRVVTRRAYPEAHSVWSKLLYPGGNLKLKDFIDWCADEHGLKMQSWDFIIGYKMGKDEDGKKTDYIGITRKIFPVKENINVSFLPSLDLSMPQATQIIMKNAAAKPTQEYIKIWKKCKENGNYEIPELLELKNNDGGFKISLDSSIREILLEMERLGNIEFNKKNLDIVNCNNIEKRLIYVLLPNESPRFLDLNSNEEIEHVASIRFNLETESG